MKLDILVYTHSSCTDVFDVFLSTLKSNIKDLDQFRLVVLTNSPKSAEQALNSNHVQNFITVQYDDGASFYKHFEALSHVIAPFFLYLQEDFFIVSPFEFSSLMRFIEIVENLRISFFRLTPSASRRSLAYLDSYKSKSKISINNETFLRVDYLSSLPACMQPTIWRSLDFLLMHKTARVENLREEWSPRYRSSFQELNLVGLASTDTSIPYLEVTAVRKGHWNFTDYEWGLVLSNILQSKDVNPLTRGIAFYKHEVTEQNSTFLRDIWRRIRY